MPGAWPEQFPSSPRHASEGYAREESILSRSWTGWPDIARWLLEKLEKARCTESLIRKSSRTAAVSSSGRPSVSARAIVVLQNTAVQSRDSPQWHICSVRMCTRRRAWQQALKPCRTGNAGRSVCPQGLPSGTHSPEVTAMCCHTDGLAELAELYRSNSACGCGRSRRSQQHT